MKQNKIPYPCNNCNRRRCSMICCRYENWFRVEWNIAVEPFRKLKEERDRRKEGIISLYEDTEERKQND